MMSGSRNILWLLPLLLALTCPLWWKGAALFLSPHSDFAMGEHRTGQRARTFSMDDVHFVQHRAGVKEWGILVDKLYTVGNESHLRLEKVDAVLFERDKGKFHITSKDGAYDTNKKILALKGNVRVINVVEGYEIRSPSLTYLDAARRVKTSSEVQVFSKNMAVSGKGLEYDMKTGDYRLDGRVNFSVW